MTSRKTAPLDTNIFDQLLKNTDKSITSLEGRNRDDIVSRISEFEKKFEEAGQIKDENERNIRVKVLEADFAKLRESLREEEADLANAVLGLNTILEQLGGEYLELQQLTPEEQAVKDQAQSRLAEAETALERAGRRWKIFGRDQAVQRANEQLEAAKQGITEAEAESRRLARKRLMNHNMEQSLQEFMYKVEKTINIIERRTGDIKQQLAAVSTRKTEAFRIKEAAARELEKLDNELNTREAELAREEDLLETYVNGSPDHARQSEKVSDLRADVEDLRGRRNNALVLFQSKEKFAIELEIHERTQMKLRDNHQMWVTSLRSDTEERVVTFKSRLEAMKAMADQDVAKQLDDIGAVIDQANAEYMAASGAASDRVRMEKIEKHPDRVANVAKAQAAQAEAIQKIRVREKKAIENFKEMYGIDPTASSFFHYDD